MAAASKLAGYSLAQADLLRRAMGKKDKEKMAKERKNSSKAARAQTNCGEKKQMPSSICWKNSRVTDSTRATAPLMA